MQFKFSNGTVMTMSQENHLFSMITQAVRIYTATDREADEPQQQWERLAQKERVEQFLRAVSALTVQAIGPEALPEKVPVTPESIVNAAAQAREANIAYQLEFTQKQAKRYALCLHENKFEFPSDPNKSWKPQAIVILLENFTPPEVNPVANRAVLSNWLRNHSTALKEAFAQLSSPAQR